MSTVIEEDGTEREWTIGEMMEAYDPEGVKAFWACQFKAMMEWYTR
jgi:hypothetical protein